MQDLNSLQAPAGPAAPDAGPLGRVHAVSGSKASIGLIGSDGLHRSGATVGKFVKIRTGHALLVAERAARAERRLGRLPAAVAPPALSPRPVRV